MEKGEHPSKCKLIQAHDDYILKIEISPNGKFMSSCSADKKIKLFKINNEGKKF
jgi:WD40 repeat protein